MPERAVIPRSPCDNGSCYNPYNDCVLMGVCDESKAAGRRGYYTPDDMQWDLNRQNMHEDNIPPTRMIIQQ
jgi:hypothetical protein